MMTAEGEGSDRPVGHRAGKPRQGFLIARAFVDVSPAPAAVDALGWVGHLFPDVRLLGTRVAMVASVDGRVLEARRAMYGRPETDPDILAMWEWPDSEFPPSPLRLVGVLADERVVGRRGFRAARNWRGFGPTALLLDRSVNDVLLWEAQLAGVAVLARTEADDGAQLIQAGASGRISTRERTTSDRWVEEHLLGKLLAEETDHE